MSGLDNTSLTVRTVGFPHDETPEETDSVIIWLSSNFAAYVLPLAAQWPGRVFTFVQNNGGSGVIEVSPSPGNTADGTTQSWQAGDGPNKGRLTVVSDGNTGWWSISSVNVSRV